MKSVYIKDIKYGAKVNSSFMIMRKLYRDGEKTIAIVGDKSGDTKAAIIDKSDKLKVGNVISVKGSLDSIFNITEFNIIKNFVVEDYLPHIERSIDGIMNEIKIISEEEFKSKECIELNNYFFNDEKFLKLFKRGIGGVSQHHNYIGGLAEHTLNVMYIAKMLAYRYDCRNKEIAILAAKLHDIGKTEELFTNGPFSYTLRGEMEGHIVIGITMLDAAFNANPEIYSEDFRERMKGCIAQHHGKLEYGSPKKPNMEEAYMVHYADKIDAVFNKISQIKKEVPKETWSAYDKRIDTKLYI